MISNDLYEPPAYETEELMFDLTFHPYNDILAASLITGEVKIFGYNESETKELATLKNHKSSCRTCLFAPDGKYFVSASEDCSLALVDSDGKLISRIKDAHEFPIYSLYFLNDNLFVSGDDEGVVKVWDAKNFTCVYEAHDQSGTITDMVASADQTSLLTTSTDGSLAVFDLRKANTATDKLYALSDSMDEDLLAVCLMKKGKRVICSSQEGSLYIFKWDWFGQAADRITGHSSSIDAMIKIDESTVITGSEDGFIRGVTIQPNKIVAFLGQHSEGEETQPIQRMAYNKNRGLLATCSFDNRIKFHNVSKFLDQHVNNKSATADEAMVESDPDEEPAEMEGDYEDMEDEDDDDDDDSDDDNNKGPRNYGKSKEGLDLASLSKKTSTKSRKKAQQAQQRKNFFSDI